MSLFADFASSLGNSREMRLCAESIQITVILKIFSLLNEKASALVENYFCCFLPKMLKEKPRLLWKCLQTNTSSHLLLHWKWRSVFYGTSLFKLLSWVIMYFQSTQPCHCLIIWLSCIFLQGFCCCLGFLFCLWWYSFGGFCVVFSFWCVG